MKQITRKQKYSCRTYSFTYFFRSPSTESNEESACPEKDKTRCHNDAPFTGGLDEDTFLAHLETQINSDGSVSSPQK